MSEGRSAMEQAWRARRWEPPLPMLLQAMLRLLALALAVLLLGRPALAATEPEATAPPAGAAAEAEPEQPSVWKQGPGRVELGHEIVIELSQSHAFLPKEFAIKALEEMGNTRDESVLGLVTAADHSADWFVVIQFDGEGHVKDDEAIDADELLSSLREGNDEVNEERKQRGFKPLTLEGWSEAPHYDKQQHRLVWALVVSDADGKSVNYNTRLLGRHGFASLNLVTAPEKLEQYKGEGSALLSRTQFAEGARYQDFEPGKDKVAEYGLAGLVAAGAGLGAAKLVKLGLLAKFGKVILLALVAGKKFIVMALVAAGVFITKLLRGRRKGEVAS